MTTRIAPLLRVRLGILGFAARLRTAAIHLTQGVAQRLNLPLVGRLLHFGQLQRLQNFFHRVEHLPKRSHDAIDLIDALGDRRGRSGFEITTRRGWCRVFAQSFRLGYFVAHLVVFFDDARLRSLAARFFDFRIGQRRARSYRLSGRNHFSGFGRAWRQGRESGPDTRRAGTPATATAPARTARARPVRICWRSRG